MSVYDGVKWGVNVKGPDSVLAAHSFQEAVAQCARINQDLLVAIEHGAFSSIHHPIMWATVGIWSDMSGGEHRPEETDWDEIV